MPIKYVNIKDIDMIIALYLIKSGFPWIYQGIAIIDEEAEQLS
jgi:hypothetical protein